MGELVNLVGLSTGVVLAGNVSVWLFGAGVMPASVSAVWMLIA